MNSAANPAPIGQPQPGAAPPKPTANVPSPPLTKQQQGAATPQPNAPGKQGEPTPKPPGRQRGVGVPSGQRAPITGVPPRSMEAQLNSYKGLVEEMKLDNNNLKLKLNEMKNRIEELLKLLFHIKQLHCKELEQEILNQIEALSKGYVTPGVETAKPKRSRFADKPKV